VFIGVYLWLMLVSFASAGEELTIGVASSLYPFMQKQAKIFEKNHDVKIRLIAGSTGRLYNQITQGAPFDVFIAADQTRPALLKTTSQSIGYGYLGIQMGHHFSHNLLDLNQLHIQRIAIANPKTAPFGKVAKQALQQAGLWHALKSKLVYAQNALQAKMMVEKGLVDAAFVAVNQDAAIARIPYIAVELVQKETVDVFLRALKRALNMANVKHPAALSNPGQALGAPHEQHDALGIHD